MVKPFIQANIGHHDAFSFLNIVGLLNLKMPFFGIHDNENIMALSRNRMCANMMSTETGDMVATFKVDFKYLTYDL